MLEDKHVPIAIDVGVNPNEITKEWLESVIIGRIHGPCPSLLRSRKLTIKHLMPAAQRTAITGTRACQTMRITTTGRHTLHLAGSGTEQAQCLQQFISLRIV